MIICPISLHWLMGLNRFFTFHHHPTPITQHPTMTYQETVEYLFNSTPVFEHVGASAYKEGLEPTKALDEHFGHPHTHFLSINIAGTNGKGSCSHTLAAILQAEGY